MEGKLLKTRTNRLLVNPVNGKYKMKPDKNYFRLKFVGEGTGTFHIDLLIFLEYSYDCNNWSTLNTTGGTDFTVSKGTVIFIRCIRNCHRLLSAVNNTTGYSSSYKFFTDTDSIDYIAEGNVASLLYTDFEGKTLVPPVSSGNNGYRGLYNLFYNCKHLVYAYDLILPFTDLVDYVYDSYVHPTQNNRGYCRMFYGCSNLTHAPKELPATVIPNYGYDSMFYGCSKLIHAPKEIPVISVPYEGFSMMFYECSSLVTAPHLKFNKLYNSSTSGSCCYLMFYGCSKLKNVQKELYPTTVYYRSYGYMFYGCKSLVNAPKLPATTLGNYCYSNMFYGCTSLVNAPELPATTLANYCYSGMFYRCISLTISPELPATTLANSCYQSMLQTTSITTAPVLPALNLVSNCYSNMFNGVNTNTKVNYIKAMFLTEPSVTYTPNWVANVAKSGIFVKNADATWENQYGTTYIPSGWTVVTAVA